FFPAHPFPISTDAAAMCPPHLATSRPPAIISTMTPDAFVAKWKPVDLPAHVAPLRNSPKHFLETNMKTILSMALVLGLGLCGLARAADEKADPVGTWKI